MPKIKIAQTEDDLPPGYVPARRIDYTEHTHDSLFAVIQEHCILKGQPLVVSNMDKATGWDTQTFSLNELKRQHGEEVVTLNMNGGFKKEVYLGDYIQTLQKNYKLNTRDQHVLKPSAVKTQTQKLTRASRAGKRDALSNKGTADSKEVVSSTTSTSKRTSTIATPKARNATLKASSSDTSTVTEGSISTSNMSTEGSSSTSNMPTEVSASISNMSTSTSNMPTEEFVSTHSMPDDAFNNMIAEVFTSVSNTSTAASTSASNMITGSSSPTSSMVTNVSESSSYISAGASYTTSNTPTKVSDIFNSSMDTETAASNSSMIAESSTTAASKKSVRPSKKGTKSCKKIIPVYHPLNFTVDKTYAKDIDCPKEYSQALENFVPEYLLPHGNNDLFSLLPEFFQAKNLMVYLGQDNTGTPIHRDLCGTMGHNVMTMGSPGAYAEWNFVLHEDREKLASVLDISKAERRKTKRGMHTKRSDNSVTKSSFLESDRAWLTYFKTKNSDFTVQVVLQRPGDLVIVPSRAYHQVRNVGVSIKVAWNRITAQTLDYAFEDQLPLYRIINRPEVYKCKAIVNFTLEEWYKQLESVKDAGFEELDKLPILRYGRESFINDSKILLSLFLHKIIAPEWLPTQDSSDIMKTDLPEETFIIKCDFCHTDIYHRYYHCDECEGYDLCMYCYAVGRSCRHVGDMTMRQGSQKLTRSMELYKQFIGLVNFVFKEEILVDESDCLSSGGPSLAMICSRIESYRRVMAGELNTFTCSHCRVGSTAAELAAKGVSLTAIFKRSLCPATPSSPFVPSSSSSSSASPSSPLSPRPSVLPACFGQPENVYVCKACSLSCTSCEPLEETNECMADYDLVYYSPASFDPRSWGAFFDFNVNKACYYPSSTLPPVSKPSRKRKFTEETGSGEKALLTTVKKTKGSKQASSSLSSASPRSAATPTTTTATTSAPSTPPPTPTPTTVTATSTTTNPARKRKLPTEEASSSQVSTRQKIV